MRLPGLRRDHPLSELSVRARGLALAAWVTVACGGAPEPPARVGPVPAGAVSAERPTPSPPEPAAPPETRASVIPTIELPAETACRLEAAGWTFMSLRLSPSGPIYGAAIRVPRARVSVAEDLGRGGVVAEADAGPVVVRGFVSADELEVFPQKMVLLAGLFVPAGGTRLAIVNAGPEKLRVKLPVVPPQLEGLGAPLEVVATCADVGLAPSSEDLAKALGDPLEKVMVAPGAPLSLSPGGSTALTFPSAGSSVVNVLERRERDVRIAWPLPAGTVVGWVAKGAVRRLDHAVGFAAGGRGGFGMGEARLPNPRIVQCPHDVSLGARIDDRKAMIGHVLAGSTLHLFQSADGLVRARIPKAAIKLFDGADLFVREPDVRDCVDSK